MGSVVIGLLSPVRDEATRRLDGGTQPALAAALAHDPIQTLLRPGLPRAARGKQVRSARRRLQPSRHPLGKPCRTVSAFARQGSPPLRPQPLPPLDDSRRRARACPGARPARTRVCSEEGEARQPPPIRGLGMAAVLAPDVRRRRAGRGRRAAASRAPFPLLLHAREPLRRS